jgi:hypothetical protein
MMYRRQSSISEALLAHLLGLGFGAAMIVGFTPAAVTLVRAWS